MKKSYMLLCIALAVSGCVRKSELSFKEIHPPFASNSPAVIGLQRSDNTTQQDCVNALWQRAQNQGTPLVEPDPDYDDYVFVTFLYRDSSSTDKIMFDIFGKYDEYRLGDMQLYRFRNTDLFYRSYTMPADICFSYRYIIEDTITGTRTLAVDPLNTNTVPTGTVHSYSWSALDLTPPEHDLNSLNATTPDGTIDTLQYYSKIMDNTRDIHIWLPPHYTRHHYPGYPVIYLFDSFIYRNRVEVPNILSNLINEGEISPMVAILIDNPTSTSRNTELPLNDQFMDFITNELVPYIRQKYNVSNQPEHNLIGGMSYGGLASAYIAWNHPELFGKVLSQSGSFWRGPILSDDHDNELREDWLPRQILNGDKRQLVFYLDWGLQENKVLSSNRKLVDLLYKKGYEYKYQEFNGWHDWSNSRKTFPEGLLYLLKQ